MGTCKGLVSVKLMEPSGQPPFFIFEVEGLQGGDWRHPAEQERKMMKKLGFDE